METTKDDCGTQNGVNGAKVPLADQKIVTRADKTVLADQDVPLVTNVEASED